MGEGSDWIVLDGDVRELAAGLPQVDHVITDPPYGAHIHKSVRSNGRRGLPDTADFACRTRRTVDLGFEHLSSPLRRACAQHFARLAKRWVITFSDVESTHLWRRSFEAAGLDYVRTMFWRKRGAPPQFTGDRPATACEGMVVAHPKGRKKWNGGGKHGFYDFPIVANRKGQQGSRVHPTQKPLELMMALIEDFTSPGDTVLDPFCGSGTTGIACSRLGRRFIGCDNGSDQNEFSPTVGQRWADIARARIIADELARAGAA